MNKLFTLFVLVLVLVLTGCASNKDTSDFSSVIGKDWKLIEVRIENPIVTREVIFDRSSLSKEKAGNVFTLKFSKGGTLTGEAAPNRYNGPYTLGEEEKSISIGPLVPTENPVLWQPERLREADYFQYLQNVYEWYVVNKRLVLFTVNAAGQEVQLIFS